MIKFENLDVFKFGKKRSGGEWRVVKRKWEEEETDGPTAYLCNHEVTEIVRAPDDEDGDMMLKVIDRQTQQEADVRADLVIGADGIRSVRP